MSALDPTPDERAWWKRLRTTKPTDADIAHWRCLIRDVMRASGGINESLDALAVECATYGRALEDAAFLRGVNARSL